MRNLSKYLYDRAAHGREGFLLARPNPVLVYRSGSTSGEDREGFKTSTDNLEGYVQPMPGSGLVTVVFEVVKKAGNPFANRVSIGRTRNCDIFFPYPRVSKYHAYFTWSDDRSHFFLTDAGATNGTWVNGKRLEPNRPLMLDDGAVLVLGPHEFVFYFPAGFYDFLGTVKDDG